MFNVRNFVRSALLAGVAIAATASVGQAQTSDNDYNYVGGGLSSEGLAIISKLRVSPSMSLRPAALVDFDFDEATFLLPVTYDASALEVADAKLLPYGGGGIRVSAGDDTDFGILLTGGADYRFSERWTANASVNLTFIEDTGLDVVAGVGYTF